MFAALAGILFASRMDAASPSVGEDGLMGEITRRPRRTSLRGGQGSIVGTVMGRAASCDAGKRIPSLMNVSGFWAACESSACVVLVAVLVELLRRRG